MMYGREKSYQIRVISSWGVVWATSGRRSVARWWRADRRADSSARRGRHQGPRAWRSSCWRWARSSVARGVRPAGVRACRAAGRPGARHRAPTGHRQVGRYVPAGVVEHQYDDARLAGPDGAGEGRQRGLEGLDVDGVEQEPDHLAAMRLDEGVEIQPPAAMMPGGARALPRGRPDPPQHRLQPDPVLVEGPSLDRLARVRGGLVGDGPGQLFLNASCSSGAAAPACTGRGTCRL